MSDQEFIHSTYEIGKAYLCRLRHGMDLSEELQNFCETNRISSGIINGIGALQNVTLGFYDQVEKKYRSTAIDEPVEIVSLLGNISMKDGSIFPHCHIAVANREHQTFAGHLMSPAKIFACEICVLRFEGEPPPGRHPDSTTGLSLWR